MGSVRDKSDDEYSVIEDKRDIGFIDIDNCSSVCNYNPFDESQIVHISIPFPMDNGKPQSGFVGETISDCVTIKNITDEHLDLWSVSIYDSKPEGSFKISLVDPQTAKSDEQFSSSFDDLVVKTDRDFKVWISCWPKEIGLYSGAVHFSIGDETIERLVFILAEDKVSKSLMSAKPYQRSRRKKQEVVNVHSDDAAYVLGQRPSKGSNSKKFRIHLKEYPIPREIREMVNNQQTPEVVCEGLNDKNYGSFFKTLLAMEEIHLEEDMRAYDMECVILKRKRNMYLTLEVPGLAEKRPSLVNGDFILAKLANEDQTGNKVYQGYIHRVEAEEIYLKFDVDQKFHNNHRDTNRYNVQFTYNRTGMRRLYQAVEAAESLNKDFLFPSNPCRTKRVSSRPLTPIACTLNEEQMIAIDMILARKGGPPYLIHGPPGTGKTMTLIEAILQIYRSQKNTRILVCAPSNAAADHILERILNEKSVQIQKNDIFRLNAFTRPYEDVNPAHIEFCSVEDFLFTCPPRVDLVKFRIIISTYTSASLLYSEGVKRGHFSYFFLDEAGQASEPETMVPLSNLYSKDSMVILAGDPMQLGPVVFSRDAEQSGLGTSYLQRLFDSELYGNMNENNENLMTKLVRNYRTHEAILRLPSELFYNGELLPCKEESASVLESCDDILPNKEFPLIFMGIQGCDEREGSNPSWFNRIEASKVVEMIKLLIEQKGMVEDDIGVITPYRQQVSKIRGALESLGWGNIKVGSVEQFQGQERQVIIISTVRSTIKHNEFDKVHYLGFLTNPRRFNVAITRAKSLLVVIGNPHILCKDPNWNDLLWYCVDNGSYKGCFLPEKEDISAEAPADAEGNWDDQGDGWAAPTDEWGNDYKPDGGNWDDKIDGWQASEAPWPPQENGITSVENDFNTWKLDVEPDEWKADEVPSGAHADMAENHTIPTGWD
ncbi:hypothetical protein CASFOL_005393 [Castilleja foliolosa]|uniref:RNA helicase n=1 Tax=Castilleja foliolosa TaxID=1961234 RepID=A0ABD3E3B2_9LAMI